MWRSISLLFAVSAITFAAVASGNDDAILYYIQLVRSTDSDQPPQPGSRLVGTKLSGAFHAVFKWKYYWEICQRKAEVRPGCSTRVRLNKQRAVDVDLTLPGKRTVVAWQDGQVVDRTIRPVGETMTVTGGNRDQKSAWFIVVRRDKPTE